MNEERVSLTDHAAHYLRSAFRGLGAEALTAGTSPDADEPEAVGIKLFRLIFADRIGQDDFREQLAALARDPDRQATQDALEDLIDDALAEDRAVAASVLGTLSAHYRRRAQAGSVEAMADLGNLLRHEGDTEGAKAAYQQAIDAGRHEALINIAHLLRRTNNYAARACLEQAIAVGDPDLTAEALVELGLVLESSGPEGRDPAAAESALLQAIQTGHQDWAPAAMHDLAWMCLRRGDADGARLAFQQAIDTGHSVWANSSGADLAWMLEEAGDLAGAREHYLRVVRSGPNGRANTALESLTILLRNDGDLDGLRALHNTAVQTGNWSAPEVRVAIGDLLEERGDNDGARVAYQQAIDDGYHGADWLIEKLHPSPKPTAAELDALPPQFDPRKMVRTGAEVLNHGLPELPEQLNYLMAIPVAYWTAPHSAVVLFLKFEREGRKHHPMVLHATYSREDDAWVAHRHFHGMGYSHDPIANPGSLRDLGGSVLVTGGGSARQPHGRAMPSVRYIALVQDGQEDLRPLESHFGAWVVSTEQSSPFQVEGRDAEGNVLGRISFTASGRLNRNVDASQGFPRS